MIILLGLMCILFVDFFFLCLHHSCREILFEKKDFPERELAALVASKVYYHLGAFDESLTYALGAGQRLDVNGSSEYVETIICKKKTMLYYNILPSILHSGTSL